MLLETIAPLLSVTVVVTDPSAFVVTVVVSEDDDEPPLGAAPEPPARLVLPAPLAGSSDDAREVLEAPMVKLMGSGLGKGAGSVGRRVPLKG